MGAKKIGQPHLGSFINDYIEGSGTAHHTQLHKTFTQKKRVEKERQQKKAKYTSIKQRKAILALSCPLYKDYKASKGFRGTGE